MSKTRLINTKFWDDQYIIDLDPVETLLFLYFLTNPMTNICGIYEIPVRRIAFDTGIDKDMVVKILGRFEEDGKMIYRNSWIGIKNFIKHQMKNPKIEVGIRIEIAKCPTQIVGWCLGDESENYVDDRPKRKKVRPSVKIKVLEMGNYRCSFCGKTKDDAVLEIDHIIPVKDGGTNEIGNLRVLCQECNGARNGKEEGGLSEGMGGQSHSNSNLNSNSNSNLNTKLIPDVIDLFQLINQSYQKWYANKTQREAIQRMLDLHGFEQLKKVISILPQTNEMSYMPTITTPLQLEDKWASLEAGLKKKKTQLQEKTPKVIFS